MPTDQPLTSGEVLKLTGLSKKELQSLDELGILQPDAQKCHGIRLYDEQSLMRIAQFTFYETLEVPLEVTREILANSGLVRPDAVLDAQMMLMYSELDVINTRMACIEAAQELVRAGKTVPWGTLTHLQRKLPGRDINFWDHFQPDSRDSASMFGNFDHTWSLYQTWKQVLICAALYEQAEIQSDATLAKSLGLERLRWQREVESADFDLKDLFDQLESTEIWLKKPPFEGVIDWLHKVEIGL